VKPAALPSTQEPCEEVVERLEAILPFEIQCLPLPPGSAGSSLLAVLEAVEQERQAMRNRAKALLSQTPSALPGWASAVSSAAMATRSRHEPWLFVGMNAKPVCA
jgi:hypothetical protein